MGNPEDQAADVPSRAATASGNRRRNSYSLLDQAASSASNALIVLAVARWVGLAATGDFAVAYSCYLLALGLLRALFGDPLLQRTATEVRATAFSFSAHGRVAMAALSAGATLLIVSLVLPRHSGDVLRVIAVGAPPLLLQDYQRYLLFGLRRHGWALASDSWWLLTAAAVFLFYPKLPGTPAQLWTAGGATAAAITTLGVILFTRQSLPEQADPRALEARRNQHDRWRRALLADYLLTQGGAQASTFIIAATAGAAALGSIRSVATPYGLLFVIYVGTGIALMTSTRSPAPYVLPILFAASSVCLAAIIQMVPASIGAGIFGAAAWHSIHILNLPIALALIGQGWVYAANIMWRRRDEVTRFLLLSVITTAAPLTGVYVGASKGGARGAAIGLAVSHLANGVLALAFSYKWLSAKDGRASPWHPQLAPGPARTRAQGCVKVE